MKQAFLDPELSAPFRLTSANSINVSRLIPQTFYYVRAAMQRPPRSRDWFVVPSGNLGNLTAGLMAQQLGLNAAGFIAATNRNDNFVRHLDGRPLLDPPALRTPSNAMDVAVPSNLERIRFLAKQDPNIPSFVTATAVDDEAALDEIGRVKREYGYLLDPHTAVGWVAAERHLERRPDADIILLATAHPAKFPDTVRAATGYEPERPPQLQGLEVRTKQSLAMPAAYEAFRGWFIQ
ncbi:MAG: hypothetical protein HC923_04850 [Myxococcales bacterium]|nr:hypothetical protein [Myxococcales bacterium]